MIGKLRLAAVIVARYVQVRLDLARYALPEVVARYSHRAPSSHHYPVRTLRRGVDRLLVLPGRPMRCLPRALVLYSLLVEQEQDPRLVLGLPTVATSIRAHAWVEIDGVDVGPSPGQNGHQPISAYPI